MRSSLFQNRSRRGKEADFAPIPHGRTVALAHRRTDYEEADFSPPPHRRTAALPHWLGPVGRVAPSTAVWLLIALLAKVTARIERVVPACFAPKAPRLVSPGQSEASPWVCGIKN